MCILSTRKLPVLKCIQNVYRTGIHCNLAVVCLHNLNYRVINLRALSSDYSLKRHRSTCVEAKAAAAAKAMHTATSGVDARNDEW